jgi:hypothetical protein
VFRRPAVKLKVRTCQDTLRVETPDTRMIAIAERPGGVDRAYIVVLTCAYNCLAHKEIRIVLYFACPSRGRRKDFAHGIAMI